MCAGACEPGIYTPTIMERSNFANTPHMLNMALPAAVEESTFW